MKRVELGAVDLSSLTTEEEVSVVGKLVIEEASELTFLIMESVDLQEDPSQIEGDKIEVVSPELLDKVFDEVPPLVGGIYAYVLKAVVNGTLNGEGNAPFTYQLAGVSGIELCRDNGDTYQYHF